MAQQQTSPRTKPLRVSVGNDILEITGFFVFGDHAAGEESARAFLNSLQSAPDAPPFADCCGAYRAFAERADGTRVYFADNAGCLCWFYRPDCAQFTDSLLASLPANERVQNHAAIAQFLYFGCVYSLDTIFAGVFRSDPNACYLVSNGRVETHSKGLPPLSAFVTTRDALERLMRRVTKAADGLTLGCAITGGTDSRSILSHLLSNGAHPRLTITGADTDADVRLAKEIAGIAGEPLSVFSDAPTPGEAWLPGVMRAADGMAGACGAYRLHRQSLGLRDAGVAVKFGGNAGELYKNSFLNQDFPFYGGKPNWERFLRFKVMTYDFPQGICAGETEREIRGMRDTLLSKFSVYEGKTKAAAYLSAGYDIMQARGITLSNMESAACTAYSPLMERAVAASAFLFPPYALEMQAWQRREVTRFCPALKDVPTDRGLTCDSARAASEWVKSTLFLLSVACSRVLRRKRVVERVDACFAEGLASPEYHAALARCKALGILAPDAANLPRSIADRVLTLGASFAE